MTTNKYSISLVIPAYNEEEPIEEALILSDAYLKNIARDYEIIVVDDGSKDRTGEIIDACARRNFHIKALHSTCNQGSGKSLFIGLKMSRCDLLVTNFADLPFDIKELDKILHLFNNSTLDFVIVSRKDRKANSIYRKITSLVNYWLIRLLFNIKVGDFQFVQIYKKNIIDEINIQSKGTFVVPEIIIKALNRGFKKAEYNTIFYSRSAGESKCGNPRVVLQTIYEMLKFWYGWIILRRKDSNPR